MKKPNLFHVVVLLLLVSLNTAFAQQEKQLYFVNLISNPNRATISQDETNRIQKAHLENINLLSKQGSLLAAGPFDGGGGFFILQAGSEAEARHMVNTDPAIMASRFLVELNPFTTYKGHICQVHENAEMIEVGFVRLKPAKGHEKDFDVQKLHRSFMAKMNPALNTMYEGWFSNLADCFMVVSDKKAEELTKLFENHPAIKKGTLEITVKNLWVADGSFCQ